jgi:hypothetical protein
VVAFQRKLVGLKTSRRKFQRHPFDGRPKLLDKNDLPVDAYCTRAAKTPQIILT